MYNTKILTRDEYIKWYGQPRPEMAEQDLTVLDNFIAQTTNQFDSLVSPYGQAGHMFRWYEALGDSSQDLYKKEKLKKAIGSWTETMIISGKFWVDSVPTMQSNVSYEIKSKANDSRVEIKRQDIIQDLTSIGLLSTSNLTWSTNQELSNDDLEEYIVVSKEFLQSNYLKLDSTNQFIKSSIDLAANQLLRVGNIEANWNGAAFPAIKGFQFPNSGSIVASPSIINKPVLDGYKLVNCEIPSTNATFKSGEKVSEVDYLGLYNKGQIERIDNNVALLGGEVANLGDQVASKNPQLIAGENITITPNPSGTQTISSTGGGGPVNPDDPLLKSSFVNTSDNGSPANPLSKGNFIIKKHNDRGFYAGTITGYVSKKDNNSSSFFPQYFDNDYYSIVSNSLLSGDNIILGANVNQPSKDTAFPKIYTNSKCFDLEQFLPGGSNLLKYWISKDPISRDAWGIVTNKKQIYPETDPTITTKIDAIETNLNTTILDVTNIQNLVGEIESKVNANTENIRDLTAQVVDCTKVDSFYKITRIITINKNDPYVVLVPNVSATIVPGYNYDAMHSRDSNLYYLPVSVEGIATVGGEVISLGGAQFGIISPTGAGTDFVIANISNTNQTVCVSYLCSDKNG